MKGNPWAWALGALVLVEIIVIIVIIVLLIRHFSPGGTIRPGNQCKKDTDCKETNYYCEGGWCVLKRGPS